MSLSFLLAVAVVSANPGSSTGKESLPINASTTATSKPVEREEGPSVSEPGDSAGKATEAANAGGVPSPNLAKLGLKKLRVLCYGTPQKPITELAARFHRDRAARALLQRNPQRARDSFRRVLRSGREDAVILRAYGQALIGTQDPKDAESSAACGELLHRVYPGT